MNSVYNFLGHNTPHFTQLKKEDDDEITKGIFWIDPKVGGCVETENGSQCCKPRVQGTLYCNYHYRLAHDSIN